MNITFPKQHLHNRQHGAALIVGLLLLVVLSLLAIAGMNSASLEFIMAGNEQYKQNAFQAAESGIQFALDNGNFVASNDTATSTITSNGNAVAGLTDTFDYVLSYSNKGQCLSGCSSGVNGGSTQLAAYYFQVASTGHATRGATITNTQGVAIEGPNDPTISGTTCTPMPNCQFLQ